MLRRGDTQQPSSEPYPRKQRLETIVEEPEKRQANASAEQPKTEPSDSGNMPVRLSIKGCCALFRLSDSQVKPDEDEGSNTCRMDSPDTK